MRGFAGEEAHLASLSVTHVFYNPSDPIAHLCAFLALIPQSLCVVYVTFFWCSREVEVCLMFAGQMLCELLNLALKRLIQEERPPQLLGRGYGMPSSHSQFAGFFATYLSLFLLLRHQPTPDTTTTTTTTPSASASSSQQTPFSQRVFVSVVAHTSALLVCASRVYLNYHSTRQVIVGWSLGVVCAISWFALTGFVRRIGVVDAVLDTALSRMARLRDLAVTEDVMEAGWVRWNEQRQRQKMGVKQGQSHGYGYGYGQRNIVNGSRKNQ